MIQILDAQRDSTSPRGREVIDITYDTPTSGEEVFVQLEDQLGKIYDGYIVNHDKTNRIISVRELPYTLNFVLIKLKQESGNSQSFNYTIDQQDNPGIPLPSTVRVSHSKNAGAIAHSAELKGGHKVFADMYDFLFMPANLMEPTMTASVLCKDEIIRTYSLLWVDPKTMPWPLKNLDAGVEGSFRNYWKLQSESRSELPHLTSVEYAPDYNGGIPPFFENPNETENFDRYTFPDGVEWNEEREFTSGSWSSVQEPKHTWKRIKEGGNGVWSKPIPINASSELYVQENRFIRAFEKPQQENTGISILSYYRGEANKYASFDMYGRIFSFYDRQPKKRAWSDLTPEEQAAYEAQFGAVADPEDPELIRAINKLYMTIATKDIYGNLRSGWSDPVLIPIGDGNLVRFSVDGKGDINKVRETIISEGITDQNVIDQIYEDIGWTDDYQYDIHNYMAYRDSTSEEWKVRQTGSELGQYVKDYYKSFPINYYDRIHNVRTKGNYTPTGINAANNPEDDITGSNWVEGVPTDIPEGYEVYRATNVLSFDGTKLLGSWSLSLFSGRTPLADFITSDKQNFIKEVENTANGQDDTVTREFNEITLSANLLKEQKDVFSLANENIKFVWKRIYNAGAPDDTVIFNNFGKVYDTANNTYTDDPSTLVDDLENPIPDGFTVIGGGKNIVINHITVNSSAIFELTIYRDVAGNNSFEGTGLEWIPYKSEKTIGDLVDRVVRSVVVSAERNQFFYKSTAEGQVLTKADIIGGSSINIKAFASNVNYDDGQWYVWNKENDYELLKETSTAQEWNVIESSSEPQYWVNLDDTDLNRNVVWNADGFDQPDVSSNVYKFQVTTPKGVEIYDTVSIVKTKDGLAARDIKIMPEQFAIPLTEDGLNFDGVTRKVFNVSSDNIQSPSFSWELRDKNDAVVSSKVGSSFIFDANFASTETDIDYKPADFATLKNLSPLYIKVTETTSTLGSLSEEGIIVTLLGGNLAIKGEEGEGGFQAVFDPNDLVPSTEDGEPIGTIDESTTVFIYKGSDPQPIGVNSGEFTVELVNIPAGVTAQTINGNKIRVTQLTDNDKDVIEFKIVENGSNDLVDESGSPVLFKYSLVKSKAGASNWSMLLSNESQIFNVDSDNKVVAHTIDGINDVIAKTSISVFRGGEEIPRSSMDFVPNGITINGDPLVLVTTFSNADGAVKYYRAENLSTGINDYPYIRVTDYSKDIHILHKGETGDTIPNIVDIEFSDLSAPVELKKSMTLNNVASPLSPRRIEIVPNGAKSFYSEDTANKELTFSVKYYEGDTLVSPWTTPIIEIDGERIYNVYSSNTLYIKKSMTDLNTGITISSGGVVGYVEIVNLEEAQGLQVLYARVKGLGSANNTVNDPYLSLGSPYGGSISYQEVKDGTQSFSKNSNSTTWYKNPTDAIWAVWRKFGDSFWSAPFKLKGEKGDKGDSITEVNVYRSATTKPSTPTGDAIPPTGWKNTVPSSGRIWSSKRTYIFVGPNEGSYGPNSEYKVYTGSSWSSPFSATGDPGSKPVYAYKATTNPDAVGTPNFTSEDGWTSGWNKYPTSTGATDGQYIVSSFCYFTDSGIRIGSWSAPVIIRFPKAADGDTGADGPPGTGILTRNVGYTVDNGAQFALIAETGNNTGAYEDIALTLSISGRMGTTHSILAFNGYVNNGVIRTSRTNANFTRLIQDSGSLQARYFYRIVSNKSVQIWARIPSSWKSLDYSVITEAADRGWTFYEGNGSNYASVGGLIEIYEKPRLLPSESPVISQILPSGTNLNDYRTPGFYYTPASATASSGSNFPSGIAGSLEVYKASGVVQIYRRYTDGLSWSRGYYIGSDSWSPWRLAEGPKGDKGDTGDTGPIGSAGSDGRTVQVTYSSSAPSTPQNGDVWIQP